MCEDVESTSNGSLNVEEAAMASGSCEVDLIYYSVPGRTDKSRRGKAYRSRSDGELLCFEAHDGVKYRPGDHVYIESASADPFIVGSISSFKMTKRDVLMVRISRFYRPDDVPEVSLSLILQERNEITSNGNADEHSPIVDTHARELFSSDAAQSYPISNLRGKCEVIFVRDFRSIDVCDLTKENSFFACLAYNQDSSRLASAQGEIRVGSSYQAQLPPEATSSVGDEPDRDELIYVPGQISEDMEKKYIQLTRSFRMFAMMDDKRSVERQARISDLLHDDSIATLHRCGYRIDEAIKEMNANDKLLASDTNFLTPEDMKKFSKGIRTYGKNFVRINRELLPMHSRDQLVAFYYLWKKTPDATKPKPLSRQRNQAVPVKKGKNGQPKASRPGSTEYNDCASASESEVEEGKCQQYACHHCYHSKSRDWHHAGRDGLLLCTDCRIFFKKYGQLRPVDRPSTVPPCLFKRSPSGTPEEESGVKTRAGKNSRRRTPSMGDERRSPSQAVSIHEFDMEKTTRKSGKRKKSSANGSAKKKKIEPEEEDVNESVNGDDKSADRSSERSLDSGTGTCEESPVTETEACASVVPVVKMEVEESKLNPAEVANLMKMEPSTSSSPPSTNSLAKEENDSGDEGDDEIEDDYTFEKGDKLAHKSSNAEFIRRVVWKNGQCSRTDFIYQLRPDSKYAKYLQEQEERAKNPVPVTPQTKKESNGIVESRIQPMDLFAAQAQAAAAAAEQQQHNQQLFMERQLMLKMQAQVEMQQQHQRQQQQLAQLQQLQQQQQQQQQQQRLLPPFMDPHGRMVQLPFQLSQPSADPRMMMNPEVLAAHMQLAQQVQMQNAMGMMQSIPMSPQDQLQMMMANPQMLQQLQQQQQLMQFGLHPGALAAVSQAMPAATSEMMRRLQQEGFRH